MEKQITYQVPLENMSWLQGRVFDLNKKATKLGTEAIVVTVIRSYTIKTKENPNRLMNEIIITGIAPKIAGWSFLGTIQHTELGNIVRVINETQVPEDFRNVKRACDHCKKDRNRKDTYLVVSESNEFKQLGKACLKDYTGHVSPAYLAALAEFIHQLNNVESESYESNSRFPLQVSSASFLRMACEAVAKDGAYITRKQSEFSNALCTSQNAWMSLFPPKGKDSSFVALTHTEAGEELYNKVVVSLGELEQKTIKSDFEHNVLMTWKKEIIENRDTGLLGAAIMIHEKELLKKIDFKKDSESNWVGTVKERTDFNVTIYKKLGFETAFGYMSMIMMKDANGNILVWKTGTGFNNVSTGDSIKIKATVKKHDEYRGVKQTILNRCVLLEEKTEQQVAN